MNSGKAIDERTPSAKPAYAETLAHIFDQTPAVAFRWAACTGWPILYASANVASWGYEAQDLCARGQSYADLIHPEDLPRVHREARMQAEQGLRGNRHEYRLRMADGSWIWVDDQTWVERDELGGERTLNGVVVDITERKRIEHALELAATMLPTMLREGEVKGPIIEGLIARLGEGMGADRVYLFETFDAPNSTQMMTSQRYEWCRPGVKPEIDNPVLQNLPLEREFPRWAKQLRAGQVVSGLVRDFSDEEREFLQSMSVLSLLVVPILLEDRVWGFLGFDSVRKERLWSPTEERVLQIAASGLGAAIQQARAVRAKEAGEQRLRLTLDAAGAGAWQWNRKRGETVWNDEHFRLLGLVPGGRPVKDDEWRDRVHPDDLASVEGGLLESFEQGVPLDLEYRVNLPEGTERCLHALGNVQYDALGEAEGLIGIVLDITERRRIEDHLRLSSTVMEATRDGVVVTDLGPRVLSINRSFCEFSGYTEAELTGRDPRVLDSGRHSPDFYRQLLNSVVSTGYWQGELWIRSKFGAVRALWATINEVRDSQGKLCSHVAVLTDLSRLRQTEDRLQRLAHYDPLTDLPNRLLVQSRLDHLLARADPNQDRMALLFVDLDGFKTVNDSLGHAMGDALLTSIAQRFDGQLGERHTLARLGGDEFLLLLEAIESPSEAALAAQNLLQVFDEPFELPGGQEVYASASVGIALYPSDGLNSGELIRNADSAMYQAKASGRSTYHFYTAELTRTANDRLALHGRLRKALTNQEFVLHYQPVLEVRSGQIVGVEALVRWQPPGQELVLPNEFIPVAEETGLILALGDWVLRAACKQMQSWRDAGLPPLRLAVNLSARQLQQPGVVWQLQDILEETGLPAEVLELELTESTLMEQGEQIVGTLVAIRALGITLAIDDFGTGYSSLAYLKRFPVHTLKIDRSFVSDLYADSNEAEIAAAIIALGRSLHLWVVAEGVETQTQLSFLRRHGCDAYQGFLSSRGLPADKIEAWLRQPKPPRRKRARKES